MDYDMFFYPPGVNPSSLYSTVYHTFVSRYFPFNTYILPIQHSCKRPKATKEKDEEGDMELKYPAY